MPDDEQIGETAAHRQTLRVLRQPAIAHLGKAEHTLDYQKRMLDFGAHLGLRAVLAALHFIYDAAMAVAPSAQVENAVAQHLPWLIGGAADLAPSTKTRLTFTEAGDF